MDDGIKKVTIGRLKNSTWSQRNPFPRGRYRLPEEEEQAQELAAGHLNDYVKKTNFLLFYLQFLLGQDRPRSKAQCPVCPTEASLG